MNQDEERKAFIKNAKAAFSRMLKKHIENPDRYGLTVSFSQEPVLRRSPDGPDTYAMGPRINTITLTEHITRDKIFEILDKGIDE